ncbi:MAG: hypothetical protein LH478_14580 [Chitinophagaceae bacterium]|nr:hypothetical protein [Chitinophagaceae bacterium]
MKKLLFFFTITVLSYNGFSQTTRSSADHFYSNFQASPNDAPPRVWWHWMNGNITKDGICKDFASMHRSGIGGFQNFNAALATPKSFESD